MGDLAIEAVVRAGALIGASMTIVSGEVMVAVGDGENRTEVLLGAPTAEIASHPYDPDNYIRDYDELVASVDSLPARQRVAPKCPANSPD